MARTDHDEEKMKISSSINHNVTSLIDRLERTHLVQSNAVIRIDVFSRSIIFSLDLSFFLVSVNDRKEEMSSVCQLEVGTNRETQVSNEGNVTDWELNEDYVPSMKTTECILPLLSPNEQWSQSIFGDHERRKIMISTAGDIDPCLVYSPLIK